MAKSCIVKMVALVSSKIHVGDRTCRIRDESGNFMSMVDADSNLDGNEDRL